MTLAVGCPPAGEGASTILQPVKNERSSGPVAEAGGRDRSASGRSSSSIAFVASVAVAIAVTAFIRIRVGASEPFWLDEAWTGVHALQPTLAAFFRDIYIDINAPLYYFMMWCWAGLFGVSTEAMRFPSLTFGLLAPLLALLPSREIDRRTRLLWSALIATWLPGIFQSQEARGYTLILTLSTGGIILHARMMARPTLSRAAAWAGVGALAILTHYYAAILFGCQGLAYLIRHRTEALKTWPAALLFVPAFGFMAYHLPQLVFYAGHTWYSTLTVSSLPRLALYAFGPGALTILFMAPGVPGCFFGIPLPSGSWKADTVMPSVLGPVLAGMVILIGLGFLRPSFTERYLTIFAPGLFLTLAVWVMSISRARAWAPFILTAASLPNVLLWAGYLQAGSSRPLNFEFASDYLMKEGAEVVRFTWDNPSNHGMTPAMMGEFGSFFFRRAGSAIRTEGVVLEAGVDPNRALIAPAQTGVLGIIWIYDLVVPNTLAAEHPPTFAAIDPTWTCRDFGRGALSVLACIQSPSAKQPL